MIGIDIIELDRVKTDMTFLNKIAHKEEIDYILSAGCDNVKKERTAALWCVKEAVMKALGLGKNSGVVFKDIKLKHDESGKPFVELLAVAKQTFEKFGKSLEVSLSHSKTCAVAVAIILK